jgi:hypothetical protein
MGTTAEAQSSVVTSLGPLLMFQCPEVVGGVGTRRSQEPHPAATNQRRWGTLSALEVREDGRGGMHLGQAEAEKVERVHLQHEERATVLAQVQVDGTGLHCSVERSLACNRTLAR